MQVARLKAVTIATIVNWVANFSMRFFFPFILVINSIVWYSGTSKCGHLWDKSVLIREVSLYFRG